jgi:hypothetical protein
MNQLATGRRRHHHHHHRRRCVKAQVFDPPFRQLGQLAATTCSLHLQSGEVCLGRDHAFSLIPRALLNHRSDYLAPVAHLFHQINHGTLAEWLTRCPAKAIPSGACVRITQVSRFPFAFLGGYPTGLGFSLFWIFDNHSDTRSEVLTRHTQVRSDSIPLVPKVIL